MTCAAAWAIAATVGLVVGTAACGGGDDAVGEQTADVVAAPTIEVLSEVVATYERASTQPPGCE